MKTERSILIAFLGNYLTNTVVAALVALVPASTTPGVFTPQYITYVVLAAVVVAILTWWYMKGMRPMSGLKTGAIFGVIGFVVAILTAFVSGLAGVLTQTGSLTQMVGIVPNFWPFIASWSTLALLCYWVIPAALVGWYLGRSAPKPMM
jgi:hypothetical protein